MTYRHRSAAKAVCLLLMAAALLFAAKTDVHAAATPAKVTAKVKSSGSGQITINWNNVANETGYKIYRRVSGGKYSVIKKVKADVTSYKDTAVQSATVYNYAVSAYRKTKAGNIREGKYSAVSAAANPVGVKPSASVRKTDGSVTVSWKKVSRASGYRLWRRPQGGKWTMLKDLGASTLKYTDSKGTLGSSYQYCVRGYIKNNGKRVYGAIKASRTVTPIMDHTSNLSASQKKFIKNIAKYVKKYAKSYGIRVHSPIIAQAILESGWGESSLSAKYHNYFGLKCGTLWKGKSVNLATREEYSPGTLTTIHDNFRVYDNMSAGVKGYFEFIQMSRYQNLKGIKNPKKYLETIRSDGYATSSSYVANTFRVITTYNLIQYDP